MQLFVPMNTNKQITRQPTTALHRFLQVSVCTIVYVQDAKVQLRREEVQYPCQREILHRPSIDRTALDLQDPNQKYSGGESDVSALPKGTAPSARRPPRCANRTPRRQTRWHCGLHSGRARSQSSICVPEPSLNTQYDAEWV